ncbi:hypothetical protein F4V43_02020 [Paenibacillus spiritus]|uniref:Uncharacterized protein n=1 Tax=Paenibacillus spiritus TaxID=2496557 RepID=A0A5J5GGF1_9BACL|nr:hypothetical protein [Paenibacillus spiritus]KAA9007286.1 hypothetical protein F4V43_02020 [Paenibacillus spiritus]
MDGVKLKGRITSSNEGSEASLIIPIGDYNIMIFSDDSCGVGNGEIIRSQIFVYKEKPSLNENERIFGTETVEADTDTLFEAMQFCQRKLRNRL